VLVLGIETSCDECGVGLVEDGYVLRANVIASQVEEHARYGGIVPEVASRQHVLQIVPTMRQALAQAGVNLDGIDAVAVTYTPGLIGSLMVGVNFAKTLALARGLPFLGVHHLEGHIYAAWLTHKDPGVNPGFPLMCLIASGGHTDLVLMKDHGRYETLGRTRDDAAGEAFDKVARILGLGFPGGPAVQRIAVGASVSRALPRAWLRNTFDFSFSGLKTAVLHRAQETGLYPPQDDQQPDQQAVAELAAAFQESVVDVLVAKLMDAANKYGAKGVLLGGGVAANSLLREETRRRSFLPVLIPPLELCTDNGAMIAAAALHHLRSKDRHLWNLDVSPTGLL
jgi:N6-L-threonylcarbamoyladenine synthase